MSSRYSQKRLLKVALPLFIVGFVASGCPYSHTKGYPFYYQADIVVEPNKTIHLVYVDNHDYAVYHMEKKGQWHKEEVVRRKNRYPQLEDSFFSSENGFCVYAELRYCRGSDEILKSTERKLNWLGGEAWNPPVLLSNNQHRIAHKRQNLELVKSVLDLNDEFIMGDEETGIKTPYLAPLPIKMFQSYTPSGFEYVLWDRDILPFYDRGAWDGISFIYKLPLRKNGVSEPDKPYYFLVAHSQDGWRVEKLGEIESTGYPTPTLNYLSFKGQRVTVIARSHIIKRDGNGKVIMEPFPPAYAKIFSNRLSGASSPNGGGSFPNIVDLEGKVHAFVNESQGDNALFKPRMYYHVYNPDAASPEIPEIRELIDARG